MLRDPSTGIASARFMALQSGAIDIADDLDPEERIGAIIQEANRRIYERARTDADVSGMGTTVTAATRCSAATR